MISKEILNKIAKELNIDICRVTNSDRLLEDKSWLEERLEKNYITEFEEEDIDRRIDPLLIMPECRSIIVIGLSYNVENKNVDLPKLRGRISKSSWGIDYHNVVRGKMESLIKRLTEITCFKYKLYVDTGPLIDRELAKKSGLGYFGKNCSIINRDYGSFISIGYILTDLLLDEDLEINSQCGDCDLCLRACPTSALEGPYKLNPKKCISYLTQTKEDIPFELRKKMGVKIYGCDTCQLVCPKNKGVKKSIHKEFEPKLHGGYIDIEDLMAVSNKEFRLRYGHMAGAWRGKNILKRNALIALANMKLVDNLDILEKELNNPSHMVRDYAKWAIENIKNNI